MATLPRPSRALFAGVLPQPPAVYDQAYMARLVDILSKLVEQIEKPSHIVAGMLTLTDLEEETPRTDVPGEVYIKDCPACGVKVLAIQPVERIEPIELVKA